MYCTEKKELGLGRRPGRSVLSAHGQVHEGEHVELCHDGEAQEHTVQEKAPAPELLVQLPLVQVNAEHLPTHRGVRGPPDGALTLSGAPKSISHTAEGIRTSESRRREVRTCWLWENNFKKS